MANPGPTRELASTERTPRPRRRWRRTPHLRAAAIAVGLAVCVHLVAFQTFRVASESMAPVLHAGDHVLVNKAVFGAPVPVLGVRLPAARPPRAGDVLLFRHPDDPRELYVKRCAGVAGDTVALSAASVTVPDDMLFVLGDNRTDSSDSREWGFLPRDLVIGRVTHVAWSSGPEGVRWGRIGRAVR